MDRNSTAKYTMRQRLLGERTDIEDQGGKPTSNADAQAGEALIKSVLRFPNINPQQLGHQGKREH